MNSKIKLVLIFIALMGITYLVFVFGGSQKSEVLDQQLVQIDTTNVSRLIIHRLNEQPLELRKKSGLWKMDLYGKEVNADASAVLYTINSIAQIEAANLVSQSPKKWNKYKVDSTGMAVAFYTKKGINFEIIIGDFIVKQNKQNLQTPNRGFRPQTMSYFRVKGQDQVYATENFSMFLIATRKEFVDRKLCNAEKSSLTEITFTDDIALQKWTLTKQDTSWYQNGEMTNQDSTLRFVGDLLELKAIEIADEGAVPNSAFPKLEIQTVGKGAKGLMTFWQDSDTTWLVQSSRNPKVYFTGKDIAINRLRELSQNLR